MRNSASKGKFWIVLDLITIIGSAVLATIYKFRTGPVEEAKGFWHGTLIHGRSMSILLVLLCGFAAALIMTSRRLHLYTPVRISSFLHEQSLSRPGLLYLRPFTYWHPLPHSRRRYSAQHRAHHGDLVTVALSLRRLIYRILLIATLSAEWNPQRSDRRNRA